MLQEILVSLRLSDLFSNDLNGLGVKRESKRWEKRVDKSENVAFSKERWRVYMRFVMRKKSVCAWGWGVGECGGGLVRMAV